MSSFPVNDVTIDVMVSVAMMPGLMRGNTFRWWWGNQSGELHPETAQETARMLLDANRRGSWPEEGDESYRFTQYYGSPDPVKMLALIRFYVYQSCDAPDWEESEACAFCDALMLHVFQLLPGYSDAPWGIHDAGEVFIGKPVKVRRVGRF